MCAIVMFSVDNMYHDHFKFYVACIHGRRYVCCSECYVVMSPPPNLCNVSVCTVVKLCFGVFALDLSLVFWIVMTSACVL